MHDIDEIRLRGHHRVDVLVGARRLVDDAFVLAALDMRRRRRVVGEREAALGLGARASGFTLPLAVSVFRINVPIAWVVGLLFLGKLYGVPMPATTLAMLVLTATLLSYSVPGLPSASLFLLSPVLAQHGIPVEDRKSTRLNSSHVKRSRMPSSA